MYVCRERLNNGQGLGFRVFTKVIDKKTLNVIMVTVGSFYSTAIPLIMAFMPDPTVETADVQCLGADDFAAFTRAWSAGGCIAMNDTITAAIRGA